MKEFWKRLRAKLSIAEFDVRPTPTTKFLPPQGGSGTAPAAKPLSSEVALLLKRIEDLEHALCEAKRDAEYQRQKVTTLRFDLAKLREAAAARDAQLADLLERNKSLVRENEHLKHPD